MKVRAFLCLLAFSSMACDGEVISDAGIADAPADAPRDAGFDADLDAGPVVGEIYDDLGPHPVGNQRIVMTDRTGERELPVELWYPAVESARAASEAGQPMAAFEAGTEHEAALAALIDGSPAACIRATTGSALAPEPVAAPAMLPVVVFSHCHACTRFDVAQVCERLASHGIVVAAPDHVGNTVFDDPPAPVGAEFLAVRTSDVQSVLDRLLTTDAAEMPEGLRGRIDPSRAAVMGHSFGAATTGPVIVEDERFVAALAIAAPVTFLGGLEATALDVPYLFLLAEEDGSIGIAGNNLIRAEFDDVTVPAWLVEVPEAGHWSFADIAGLGGQFTAGCAELDDRFAYPDPTGLRELAADVAAAYFASRLLDDPLGDEFLRTGFRERASVTRRN